MTEAEEHDGLLGVLLRHMLPLQEDQGNALYENRAFKGRFQHSFISIFPLR